MTFGLCSVSTGNLISEQEVEDNFADLHHPFNLLQAKTEAARCLYCFDAACIKACPTSIDIPTFIHQIGTENINGSARTILSENIMGGTCARACPTEVLCEQACVLNTSVDKPIDIGLLQRFSVDSLLDADGEHPFKRQTLTGKKIAVIGAGPAGLSCAHRAAMLGHDVTVFEAKQKPGGLNEYGLAAYKMVDDFAQKEVEFLLNIGGITIEYEKTFGEDILLVNLQKRYDAIFIGVGLGQVNQLGIDGEDSEEVLDAIHFIENIRQAKNKSSVKVGNQVIVIGAGNTAIDAAIQAKRLGAKNVSLVYRRGEKNMSATPWEIDLARRNQVKLVFWAAPKDFDSKKSEMTFETTQLVDGQLMLTGETFSLEADFVLKAIGQKFDDELFSKSANENKLTIKNGKVSVSENYQTNIDGVFAGGDCVSSGEDLTVQAVQDGKLAAHAIDTYLSRNSIDTNSNNIVGKE